MSLARQNPRTCLMWRHLGQKLGTRNGKLLWHAFYRCLEDIGQSLDGVPAMREKVRGFLEQLLKGGVCPEARNRLRQELAETPSVLEVLRSWQANGAVDQLFDQRIDRSAASFYLGQMAYLLGLLRVAREYATHAYVQLPFEKKPGDETGAPLALTILEFLIVTLVLEINFLAEGRDARRSRDGRPRISVPEKIQAWLERDESHARNFADFVETAADQKLLESFKTLLRRKEEYARNFAELGDADRRRLQRHLARTDKDSRKEREALPAPVRALIEEFTSLNLDYDVIDQGLSDALVESPQDLEPLALAVELSRKNHAGMLLFRLREWHKSRETFESVIQAIERFRAAGRRDGGSILTPLVLEAEVYLGRLSALRCLFHEGERQLRHAIGQYEEADDVFAENKARKYFAELKYRQLDLPEAEALFLRVRETSERMGFDHDASAAEVFLGKIYSRIGFQDWAVELFEKAHAQIGENGIRREYIDSIFWQAAAQARWIDLDGHPKVRIAAAKAILKTYSRLFHGVERLAEKKGRHPQWSDRIDGLLQSIGHERHPDLLEAMLELRLGRLPGDRVLRSLAELALKNDTRAGWQSEAHAFLCRQMVRLVRLQQMSGSKGETSRDEPAVYSPKELSKYFVRDAFIASLECLAGSDTWDAMAISRQVQKTFELRQELDLKGMFVPSLVDTSQFFADRTSYVGLLLLLQLALDEGIRLNTTLDEDERLDVEVLKRVYRSITKYLVLERNFYLGPPIFNETRTPRLWRRLEKKKPVPDCWSRLYEKALLGGHGLDYPSNYTALGFVDRLDRASATLEVIPIDDQRGMPITESSFKTLTVPIEVVEAGHAVEALDPVVLLGRTGQLDNSSEHWVAHRIPSVDKWQLFEEELYGQPRIEAWQKIFSRFVGDRPAVCHTPKVDPELVEEQYRCYAREWFSDKLPRGMFRQIFGLSSEPGAKNWDLDVRLSKIVGKLPPTLQRDQAIERVWESLRSEEILIQKDELVETMMMMESPWAA